MDMWKRKLQFSSTFILFASFKKVYIFQFYSHRIFEFHIKNANINLLIFLNVGRLNSEQVLIL